jgi:hypothetical protein
MVASCAWRPCRVSALVVEYNASRMLLVVRWPLLVAHEMRQCRLFAVATRMCKHAARVLLHVVCCLLRVVCYLLSVAFCTVLVGCYSLRDGCCMLHVAWCVLHAICCLLLRPLHHACCHDARCMKSCVFAWYVLHVACRLLCAAHCPLRLVFECPHVVCCTLHAVCIVLHVVRCMSFVACCRVAQHHRPPCAS